MAKKLYFEKELTDGWRAAGEGRDDLRRHRSDGGGLLLGERLHRGGRAGVPPGEQ